MTNLARRISPLALFMLSMNAIIGSGWLFAPLYAAKVAGSAAIFSWMIGGMAAILIAYTFAELSAMLPVAGGTAHIPQLSHGTFASFILSWIAWVTSLMTTPIEVQAVLQYASLYFSSLMHTVDGVATLTLNGYLWAAILMALLSIINIASYNSLMRFTYAVFIFKFVVILLTIFAIWHVKFDPTNFTGLMAATRSADGWHAIFSAVATGGVVLAFNGFKSGVELAGEAKNLAISIPLSTVGAVVACLLLYLGLQICFIGGIDKSALQHGWSQLNFTGEMGPLVSLAAGLGLVFLLKLLYANAVISPLGAGLIYVASTARILYAMSKIGYVPQFLSKLNRHHFPMWAILINFFLGMLSFLPLPGWQAMVNFFVSAIVITYAMGPIALVCLRMSMPETPRPFRLPAANFFCLLAFYFCNLFSYWTGWATISKLAIVLAAGLILFLAACLRGRMTLNKQELRSAFWIMPYLFGLVLISYLGSFGGQNYITFGWDFLVIALFSLGIMQLAIRTRLLLDAKQIRECLGSEALLMQGS